MKRVWIVIAALALVLAGYFYLYSYNQQPRINVNAWIGDIVYSESVNISKPVDCNGRAINVIYYANATLDGNLVKDANFTLNVYNSNGTIYSDSNINLEFNSTIQTWKRGIVYMCIPLGRYYGKIDLSVKKGDMLVNASTVTQEFQVRA